MTYAFIGAQARAEGSLLLVILGSVTVPGAALLLKGVWQQYLPKQTLANTRDATSLSRIDACFTVSHHYPVLFDNRVFDSANPVLRNLLIQCRSSQNHHTCQNVFVYIDGGVHNTNPDLYQSICTYFQDHHTALRLVAQPKVIVGGENAKHHDHIEALYQQMLHHQLDRHSCVIAIGGGAVLDAVGFACATFHRGVKLVRLPSTVLAQNDAGVGVKNGFNRANSKNLIGTFTPPAAVLNDASLLQSLSIRDRRAGLAEAVKVAAIRDAAFFSWLEDNGGRLNRCDDKATQYAIARCAQLHIAQITGGGDPFENGSARPLDYGHWSAHKLESIARYTIRHGEAVAIGMALDARYAVNIGMLSESQGERLIHLLEALGFTLWHHGLEKRNAEGQLLLLRGLEEFRQHLGGQLSITLLRTLGNGEEVHTIDDQQMLHALHWLKKRAHIVQKATDPATVSEGC